MKFVKEEGCLHSKVEKYICYIIKIHIELEKECLARMKRIGTGIANFKYEIFRAIDKPKKGSFDVKDLFELLKDFKISVNPTEAIQLYKTLLCDRKQRVLTSDTFFNFLEKRNNNFVEFEEIENDLERFSLGPSSHNMSYEERLIMSSHKLNQLSPGDKITYLDPTYDSFSIKSSQKNPSYTKPPSYKKINKKELGNRADESNRENINTMNHRVERVSMAPRAKDMIERDTPNRAPFQRVDLNIQERNSSTNSRKYVPFYEPEEEDDEDEFSYQMTERNRPTSERIEPFNLNPQKLDLKNSSEKIKDSRLQQRFEEIKEFSIDDELIQEIDLGTGSVNGFPNSIYTFFFKDLMQCEEKLEEVRCQLAESNDFNVAALFEYVDEEFTGIITIDEMKQLVLDLGCTDIEDNLYNMFTLRYFGDETDKITFSAFSSIFYPFSSVFFHLMRDKMYSENSRTHYERFSSATIELLKEFFDLIIQEERVCEIYGEQLSYDEFKSFLEEVGCDEGCLRFTTFEECDAFLMYSASCKRNIFGLFDTSGEGTINHKDVLNYIFIN